MNKIKNTMEQKNILNENVTNQITIDDRPKTLDKFVGNSFVKNQVNSWFKKNTIPKCVFITGESGLGKTTLANIIANHIASNTSAKIEEIDCSQLTKADAVEFVNRCSVGKSLMYQKHIYILNEAQSLTKGASDALLVMLEKKDSSTYYFLTAMDETKISKAIINRCAYLKLEPLKDQDLKVLVKPYFAKFKESNIPVEKVEIILRNVITNSQGVPRKALQTLNQYLSVDNFDDINELETQTDLDSIYNKLAVALVGNDARWVTQLMTSITWTANDWLKFCYPLSCIFYKILFNIDLKGSYYTLKFIKEKNYSITYDLFIKLFNEHLEFSKSIRMSNFVNNSVIYEYFAKMLFILKEYKEQQNTNNK